MKIQCSELDNLLMEGDAAAMRVAQEHARECAGCAETLASWNDITHTARGMHATWTNDMLWPRIERSLRNDRRSSRSWIWQVAAALVLLVGLATAAWKLNEERHADDYILRAAAVDEVERAERQHVAAINHLEKVAGAKLDDPATPLLVSYKEKLMLLDDAIAECQTAIDQNRNNTRLRKQLLAIYSEKQRTLQDVLREDNHETNR
jgi:hypothetical protein